MKGAAIFRIETYGIREVMNLNARSNRFVAAGRDQHDRPGARPLPMDVLGI